MQALQGVGVLVTRPEQQASSLCRLLESLGAIAIQLPAIDIKPAGDLHELAARVGRLESFDLVIFTSANAVRFGAPLLAPQRHPALAAIGPATASALSQAGCRVTVTPTTGFDSEGLLLHPRLANVAGQRILIIKGERGRDLLREQLARDGALVSVAEVYKRERAVHGAAVLASLAAALATGAIHIVTATSAEIAFSLLEMATPVLRREFDRVCWVVPSDRVADAIRERGMSARLLRAASAEDQDLVAAIVRWRSSVSGA